MNVFYTEEGTPYMMGKLIHIYSPVRNIVEVLDDNLILKFMIYEECCQCYMCYCICHCCLVIYKK